MKVLQDLGFARPFDLFTTLWRRPV